MDSFLSRGKPSTRHRRRRDSARRRDRSPLRLVLESLEQRRVLDAVPTIAFVDDPGNGVPLVADPFIGEQSSFTLRFNNASPTDAGFGPYVDLYFPATGADGDDGISFGSASYLGMSLAATTVTLTDSGVPHPFAKDANGNPLLITPPAGFQAGDTLVVLQLPFGSFTAGQPPVDIDVSYTTSSLADVGTGLPVQAQAGFRYGNDGLDNPTSDPTITGASASQTFTPAVFRVTKENLAPEHETATGPNFTRQFRVRVDVADGQTVTDLELSDTLPDTLQYVSLDAVSGQGSGSVTIVSTPSTASPGGTLARSLDQVVGTTGGVDAEMTFSYFVPVNDAGAAAVIDATTGDDRTITNIADASGDWTPLDPRDAPGTLSSSATNNHDLVAKSLATQKSVTNVSNPGSGPVPGNVLQYTVNFQVSDYFAFEDLVITDLLGDGQSLDGSFTPLLSVNDGHSSGAISGVAFDAANLTEEVNAVGGADRITFRVSDELALRGFSTDGRLVGGMIPAGGTGGGAPAAGPPTLFGGTTGSITFRAVVNDAYDVDFPSGDAALDPGDSVTNNVTVAGGLLAVADLSSQGTTEADTSSTSVTVPQGSFSKEVYAVNGTVGSYPATTPVTVGDTVTYRLRYTLPTSDVENLVLTDYLPLPIFDVDDAGTGVLAFDAAADGTGDAPAAGTWTYNSGDTFHTVTGLTPTITNDSAANSVTFSYGTYDDLSNTASVIDILFTVTANAQPFADSLRLANRATLSAQNTDLEAETGDSIAEVTSSTPELRITKGIVATDNAAGVFTPSTVGPVTFDQPNSATGDAAFAGTVSSVNLAAQPINSDLSEVDNGDLVTYAIVVENQGSGRFGAFDTVIKDSPAAGMGIPGFGTQGINLRVTDGAGNPLAYTPIGTGLFEGGIRLVDPSASEGAIGRGIDANGSTVTDGSNIVVITYDMQVLENPVLSQLTNTGAVTNYASTDGGPDFTGAGSLTDPAVITIATENLLDKELVSTEIVDAFNAANEAVIGELVTYRVTITVPEAIMPDAVLVDRLDNRNRLAFVEMVGADTGFGPGVTVSSGVSFTGSAVPTVTDNGRRLEFDLGSITNSDTDNATVETITFEYRAVVLNTASANAGGRVRNTASLSFDGLDNPKTARAATVTIIEPRVAVTKSAVFDDGQPTGDADDAVTYTITLRNPPGSQATTADAFDVTFEDDLPVNSSTGESMIVGDGNPTPVFSVVDSAGLVTAADFELVGDDATGYTLRTLPGGSFDLPVDASRTITITIQGKLPTALSGLVTPGEVISNTAAALWSSLDGDLSTPRSTFNTDSVERTGAGGVDDYRATASDDLRVAGVGIDKSVVATSESATSNAERVVVGEIVRYRLEAVVPEGATASLVLEDEIPAGLQFLDDGTAFVAFVSNGGGISSSTISSGSGLEVSGDTALGVTPSFDVPAAAILGGPFASGTDVSFDFGSVTNADSDPDSEFIVVEFNALVTNVATNQADASLTNRVNVVVNSATTGTASTVLRVAEPVFRTTAKLAVETDDVTPAAGPFDAGDSVRYLIDLIAETGNGRSIAYDTLVSDTLPAEMTYTPGSLRVFRDTSEIFTGFTSSVVGGQIDVTIDEIAPGEEIRIFYDVTLEETVEAGSSLSNAIDVVYTSLPGDGTQANPTGSIVPGASGDAAGERNGSDGAGGLNDYFGEADTAITIAQPDFEKLVFETSPVETEYGQFDPDVIDFTVGEVVTYRLTATVPEGTTESLVLRDVLPGGGRLVPYVSSRAIPPRVVSVGSNISGSSLQVGDLGVYDAAAGTYTFDFGTVVNTPDNQVTAAGDTITVEFQVQLANIASNVAGASITNTGEAIFEVGGNPVTLTDTAVAEVVEPVLTVAKVVVDGGGTVDAITADMGDVVTYRVTVAHDASSTGTAFSVKVADTLPAGLELVPGSVVVVSHPDYASSFYDQPVVTENGNGFEAVIDYLVHPDSSYALGGGQDIAVVEYQATVTTAVAGGTTLTNTADVTYDSLFGERPSSAFPDTTRGYATSDTAAVTTQVVDLSIIKDDGSDSYVPGLPISYTITVSNDGPGLATGAVVSDDIPDAIQNPTWTAIYTGSGASGPASGSGDINATIDLPAAGTAVFTVTGTVASTATGNLVNTAEVTTPGSTGDPTPGNNTSTDTNTPDPQADLSISKTDGQDFYSPGVPLTYTIVVTNDGPSFVTAATVSDPLPAVLTSPTWSVVYSGVGSSGPASGSGDINASINLAAGGTATFTVTGTIDTTASGDLVNVATVTEPPGTTDPDPGNNTATDTDEFQPEVDLTITKTDGREVYRAGEDVVYTIVVTNEGPGSAIQARVVDTLPVEIATATWTASYSPGSSGPTSGSSSGRNGIDALVDLLPDGSAIFTLTGRVDADAYGNLVNTATVSPGPGSVDTDPGNNSASDTSSRPLLAVGTDIDCESAPTVTLIDPASGEVVSQFLAYEPGFRGGTRVALADVDGDGAVEVVVAPGMGRQGLLKVFEIDGTERPEYRRLPFGGGYFAGISIDTGDVDGDGVEDLLVGQSRGGRVHLYRGIAGTPGWEAAPFRSFDPFGPSHLGGVSVALVDVGSFAGGRLVDATSGDGRREIAVATGPGSEGRVAVFDVSAGANAVRQFVPQAGYRGGYSLDGFRYDADGVEDLLVAGGLSAGSQTTIYSGLLGGSAPQRLAAFASYAGVDDSGAPSHAAGVDLDGDGRADSIFAQLGSGSDGIGMRVLGTDGSLSNTLALLRSPLGPARISTAAAPAGLVTSSTGLQWEVIRDGSGPLAQTGQRLSTHYVGSRVNGEVFDSSRGRGTPFSFTLGRGQVIAGWDEAFASMQVGERRRIYVPPNLAYGNNPPAGSVIQPGDTLVFDVELLSAS